jgi:hypothetical protein
VDDEAPPEFIQARVHKKKRMGYLLPRGSGPKGPPRSGL